MTPKPLTGSAWNTVTGDNGTEYLEWNGQDRLVFTIEQPDTASTSYTIDVVFALRNAQWYNRPVPDALMTSGQWQLIGYLTDSTTLPAGQWLPPDTYQEPEPELPTGRFQNLDWAS